MLVIISPAKRLDTEKPAATANYSQPALLGEARTLMNRLAEMSRADIRKLMKVNENIAESSYRRHQAFETPFTPDNAKQAAFLFQGDTYTGLDAASLSEDDLGFAQDHLRILSGLYGVLRPLDLIQPYRLEMGAKLDTDAGEDLYDFWNGRITEALNEALNKAGGPVINCASVEYFSAVQKDRLEAPVITPVFKDGKDGKYRVLGFFAKKARGMMARHIIENRIENVAELKAFNAEGYEFDPESSSDTEFVFLREQPPPARK